MGSVCAVTMLMCFQAAVATPAEAEAKPQALHEHPTIVRMWHRNNELRSRVGLRAQRLCPRLTRAAQDHAWFMARTRSFSHHSNGGPMGRAHRYGYTGMVSENIAMGQPTVESAFHAWQNSSGHWANMTSNTQDAGFGYAIAPDGSAYWVAMYGNP